MMKIKLWIIVFILAVLSNAWADMYEYKDKNGKGYLVNDLESVPAEYRGQAKILIKESLNASKNVKPIMLNSETVDSTKDKSLDQRIRERAAKEKARNAANGSKPIEIYVTSWCPHCRNLEAFLKSQKITYIRYDTEKDKEARSRLYKMDPGGGVPLIILGDKIVSGNNQQAVLDYLKK